MSPAAADQRSQRVRVGRFCQVLIKARVAGAGTVLGLCPAGEGNQLQKRVAALASQVERKLVAVSNRKLQPEVRGDAPPRSPRGGIRATDDLKVVRTRAPVCQPAAPESTGRPAKAPASDPTATRVPTLKEVFARPHRHISRA